MAKNKDIEKDLKKGKRKDDLSFDDLDDLDSLDAGFDADPLGNDRNAVGKVAGSFKDGALMKLKDPRFHRKFVEGALPGGYAKAFDGADKVTSSMRDLYNSTAREIRPVMRDINRATKRMFPSKPSFVPDALAKKLDEWTGGKKRASSGPSAKEQEDANVAMQVGEIFQKQAEHQAIKDERAEIEGTAEKMIKKQRFDTTAQMLENVRQNTEKLVGYQDNILYSYQKKSLELQLRQYFTSKKMLAVFQQHAEKSSASYDAMVKNTSLPDILKQRNMELAGQMIRERFLGDALEKPLDFMSGFGERLRENLTKRMKEGVQQAGEIVSGVADMADMMSEDDEMAPGKSEMAANMVGGGAIEWLAKKLIVPARKQLNKSDKIRSGDQFLRYVTDNPEQIVANWQKSGTKLPGIFGSFEELVKESLGGYKRDDKLQGSMLDDLDESAQFNLQTRKTITDVIPGWLGKIHAEIKMSRTGQDGLEPETFDWESGKFETRQQKVSRVAGRIFDKDRIASSREKIDEFVNTAAGEEGELSPRAISALRHWTLQAVTNGTTIDPWSLADPEFYGNMDSAVKDELAEHFQKKLGQKAPDMFTGRRGGIKDAWKNITTNESGFRNARELGSRWEDLLGEFPNAKEELLRFAKSGQLGELEGMGILKSGPGGYEIDNERFLDLWRKGGLAGSVGGGSGAARGPGKNPFGGGPSPLSPPPMGGLDLGGYGPMDQEVAKTVSIENDDLDRMEKALNAVGAKLEKAILESCGEKDREEVTPYLEEILAILEEGIPVGQAAPQKGRVGRAARWAGGKVRKTLGGIKDWGHKKFGQSKKLLGQAKDLAFSGAGMVGNTIKDLWEAGKNKVVDVYVKGREDPPITAEGLRRGWYLDVNTGEIIKSFNDITGPVKDVRFNEVVLSAKEYAMGLYDEKGKPLKEKAMSFVGDAFGFVKNQLEKSQNALSSALAIGTDILTGARDIYVRGEESTGEPRMYAHKMRKGLYFDQKTLDTIRRFEDIKGPVLDNEGNVVLDEEDFKKGLVDSKGRPIKGVSEKVLDKLEGTFGLSKEAWQGLIKVGKGAKDRVTNFYGGLMDFFRGDGEDGDGKMFSLFGGRDSKLLEEVRNIKDILLDRMEPKEKTNRWDDPSDDDNFREGSWRERMAAAKKKRATNKKAKKEAKKVRRGEDGEEDEGGGLLSMLLGGLGTGGSLLAGGLGSILGSLIPGMAKGGFNMAKGAGKMALKTVTKPTSMLWGGAKKLAGSAFKKGGMINTAGRFLGRNALSLGGRALAAAPGMLSTAGSVLGSIATGLASVITAPVAIGAAIVGGLAVGGYFLYKNLSTDYTSLARIRLIEYGVDPGDEDRVKMIAALEKKLMEHVDLSAPGGAKIKDGVDALPLIKIFGVDPEDQEAVRRWALWFGKRFKPVFLTHLKLYNDMSGKKDISKIDDTLSNKQKQDFIKRSKFSGDARNSPYRFMMAPWGDTGFFEGDELDYDTEDVMEEYKDAEEEIMELDASKKKDKPKEKAKAAVDKEKRKKEKEKAKAAESKVKRTKDPYAGSYRGESEAADMDAVVNDVKQNDQGLKGKGKLDKGWLSSMWDGIKGGVSGATAGLTAAGSLIGKGASALYKGTGMKAAHGAMASGISSLYQGSRLQAGVNAAGSALAGSTAGVLGKKAYDLFKDTFYDDDKGEWVWPTWGDISSVYGPRKHPIKGRRSMHKGVDIAAPEGTPVRACAKGVIIRREYSQSYGNVIYIKHGNGMVSRYAHMSRFAPGYQQGSVVEKGEVIGFVGNTGASAGNHLHFEIRKNDKGNRAGTVDPVRFIRDAEAKKQMAAVKDEQKRASAGKAADGYEDESDDPMEGRNTITSSASGKTETDKKEEQAKSAWWKFGFGDDDEEDIVKAKDSKTRRAKQVEAQQAAGQAKLNRDMADMVSVLRKSYNVQRSMDHSLKQVVDIVAQVDGNTRGLKHVNNISGFERDREEAPRNQPRRANNTPEDSRRPPPVDVGNTF